MKVFKNIITSVLSILLILNINQINLTAVPKGLEPPKPPSDHWQPSAAAAFGKKNGKVLRKRVTRLNRIPSLRTEQLAFKSTDSFGKPIVATTTVIFPKNVRKNAPILSIQHFINAIGTDCNPSQVLIHQENFDEWWDLSIPAIIEAAMQRGAIVAIPDHLGPEMVYPGGPIGGHITLDGLKAMRSEYGLRKSKTVLLGYSGGAISTGFAAIQKKKYAPDLNIVGAMYGGIPADIIGLYKKLTHALDVKSPVVGLVFMAALGLERQFPELRVTPRLSKKGKEFRSKVNNACVKEVTGMGSDYTLRELAKPGVNYAKEDVSVLKKISLKYQNEVPSIPTLLFHSRNDDLLPFNDVLFMAKKYCRANAPVQLRTMNIPQHVGAIFESISFATTFADKRIAGAPFYNDCSSIMTEKYKK